jgi:hypothetical protein
VRDSYGYGIKPVSYEEAHGDGWVARIKAQHEALGARCPCGNGVDEEEVSEEASAD